MTPTAEPVGHRSRRVRLGLTLLLVGVLVLAAALLARPGARRAPPSPALAHLGVYLGAGDPAAFAAFAHRLGGHPAFVSDYLDATSWSTIANPDWLLSQWSHSGARLLLSVPMLPSSGGASLAQEATGADDGVFRTLARRLVAGGGADTILRIGWEFNGDWFPWSIEDGHAAQYAGAWRQIVTTMRAVPGARFRFDWCVNGGSSVDGGARLDPAAAWPGERYVDIVGLDQYDAAPATYDTATQRWQRFLDQPYGLRWQRDFAAAHHKPVSFPEWGLLQGGDSAAGQIGAGDSPQFVQEMFEWFASADLAYESYFDLDTPVGASALAMFPRAAERYRQLADGDAGSLRR